MTALKIDTNFITTSFRSIKKYYSQLKNKEESKKENKEQHKNENDIISNEINICSVQNLTSLQYHLNNLNTQEFGKLVNENFYNPDVMDSTSCILDSIFYSQPLHHNNLQTIIRIRNTLRNITRIDEPSVNGIAMTADLKDAKKTLILKSPREGKDLTHEYFIGVFGTNKLRRATENYPGVYNFAYIMGKFACYPPIPDPTNKSIASFCSNDITQDKVTYVVYENIAPAVSLLEYLEICTFEEWLNIYMQILFALYIANERIYFTHYDLHPGNVLIRDLKKEEFYLEYITDNGKEYLKTTKLATIIDYGMSHIKYNDKDYGFYGLEASSVLNIRFPMYDSYKLLMFSIFYMEEYNREDLLKEVEPIFRFFNPTDNMLTAIEKQYNDLYELPYEKKLQKITQLDLANYIREKYNIPLFKNINKSLVIGCDGNKCIKIGESINELGLSSNEYVAEDIFEAYDIAYILDENGKREELLKFINSINIDDMNTNTINEIELHSIVFETFKNTFEYIYLKENDHSYIFSKEGLSQYKNMVSEILEAYDSYQIARLLITASIFINNLSEKKDILNELLKLEKTLKNNARIFIDIIKMLEANATYVENLSMNKELNRKYKIEYKYSFYYSYDLSLVVNLFQI
jgi:hypothetical protein